MSRGQIFSAEEIAAVEEVFQDSLLTEVEQLVDREGDLSYLEAIMHLCEKHGLEVEAVAAQLKTNKEFRGKFQVEAKSLRLPKPETPKRTRGRKVQLELHREFWKCLTTLNNR
jgi:hypothetical protein